MKKLEDLQVKVTYVVHLGDLEVPNDISEQAYNELVEMDRTGINICDWGDLKFPNALEWLKKNIEEQDAMELNYEIELLNEGE